MKSFVSSVLIVGLFGFVLGGVYRSPDGYVQPAITTQHHLIATGTNVHYSPISAADGSSGYPNSVSSGGYGAPAPAPAAPSGGYGAPAPAPVALSSGYAPAPAPVAPSGGYSSGGAIDSFADPRNRGPEPPAPKPVYGLPAMLALASSSDGSASSGSSSDSFGGRISILKNSMRPLSPKTLYQSKLPQPSQRQRLFQLTRKTSQTLISLHPGSRSFPEHGLLLRNNLLPFWDS